MVRTGALMGMLYDPEGLNASLKQHGYQAARLLYKWLNRRSQRRSVAWARFLQVVAPRLSRPRIVHNLYPTLPWMTQAGSRME
jgi:hypothetical protein